MQFQIFIYIFYIYSDYLQKKHINQEQKSLYKCTYTSYIFEIRVLLQFIYKLIGCGYLCNTLILPYLTNSTHNRAPIDTFSNQSYFHRGHPDKNRRWLSFFHSLQELMDYVDFRERNPLPIDRKIA